MPTNIAQLLYVVRILLEYGRHLAATIERRAAAPGFGLFAALFGTARLPVILAYLHRGVLRATALESLLRERAATGRDVAMAPLHTCSEPDADNAKAKIDPLHEPLGAQFARLAAERAEHDAPIDPDHLPTLEAIEAEIRDRPIGLTIAHIRRDLGIVAGLCTRAFWDAVTEAVFCSESSALKCPDETPYKSELFQREQKDDPVAEHMQHRSSLEDDLPSEQMQGPSTLEYDPTSQQMQASPTPEEDPPSQQMQASSTSVYDPGLEQSDRGVPQHQNQSLSGNIFQPTHVEARNPTVPQHSVVQRVFRPDSQRPRFGLGEPPFDPFSDMPASAKHRHDVPVKKYNTATTKATGPPPRPAIKLAA